MSGTLTNRQVYAKTRQYLTDQYDPYPISIERAEEDGLWLVDVEGNRYLDMVAQYSTVGLGNCNWEAGLTALHQFFHIGMIPGFFCNSVRAESARLLAEFTGMDKVIFMNAGAEVFDTGVKLARKWASKTRGIESGDVVVCPNNFHGRTLAAISASTREQYREGFGPLMPGFRWVRFGDIKDLEKAIDKSTIAFLIEPMQAEGGINVPPDGYLKAAREICRKNQMLFILDEVQTGFYRTGPLFAWQYDGFNAKPDMMLLGKMLGGGFYPISAVVGCNSVMEVFKPGDHGSTFGGSPIACAVVWQVIQAFKSRLDLLETRTKGAYFMDSLKSIFEKVKNPFFKDVRGRGLLVGIKFKSKVAPIFQKRLLEEGIICGTAQDDVLRFSPPLIITKAQIDWALERIERALRIKTGEGR